MKPTLVELVAQVISLTKEDRIGAKEIFWKKYLGQADAAVYTVLLGHRNKSICRSVGLKRRKFKP